MAIYVGRVTVTSGSVLNPSAIPGLATGDWLLVFLASSNPATTHAVPGYTQIAQVAGSTIRASAWFKQVSGAPASEPQINITWFGYVVGEVQAWRGLDPTTLLDVAANTAVGSVSPISTASVTTVTAGAVALHAVYVWDAGGNVSAALNGNAPFDTGVAVTLMQPSGYVKQRQFRHDMGAPGATGAASATYPTPTETASFLFALRPNPPIQADTSETSTFGAAQDASYDPTIRGLDTAAAVLATTQDAIQAEIGAHAAAVAFDVTQSAALDWAAAPDAVAVVFGAILDATALAPGEVWYPGPDTWAAVITGLTPVPTEVRITDSVGATLVIHLTDSGIVPEDQAAATLAVAQDAGYWTPGEAEAAARFGATQDAAQADVDASAAAVTLGAAHDGEFQPLYRPTWLARFIRMAWTWVGGPYRRVPADQSADAALAVVLDALQDGNFTPRYAVADVALAVVLSVGQDATFIIVEPAVHVSVPAIPYGRAVKAIPLGHYVASIPWRAHEVHADSLGVRVPVHPQNFLVPATRLRRQ